MLTWLGGVALGATALAAVLVAVVYGLLWFSAARLAGFLTAFAFSAAFFSAASGRDSAAAGRTAAGASTASAETARRAYGQQLYELARATHADLTTGEVARARDVLGGVGRRRQAYWPPEGSGVDLAPLGDSLRSPGYTDAHMQLEDARRAWFTLLWCFQRVLAARELIAQAPAEATYGAETPVAFLDRLVRDQIRFLNGELHHARAALEEFFVQRIDDRESAAAFRSLVPIVLGDETPLGRWALPLSTHAGEALRVLLINDSTDLVFEDVALAQYQALHCLLDADGDQEKCAAERQILPEKLRRRRVELDRPGGPQRSAIGDDRRSPGDLELWASTYADPSQLPNPRLWLTP